jgi:riboflavin biosynthesis pyrimidine reductase
MRRLWPDPADIDDVAAMVAGAARPTPAGRPWLLVNMISSLDGAITIDGRSGGLARPADKAMFSALRAVSDVVLAGAGTVRAERYGPARLSTELRAARRERGQPEVPRLAIASRSLELDVRSPLFTESEARPLVLTCQAAPRDRQQALSEVADLVVAGDVSVDLAAVMRALHEQGVGTITCEGGPHLNGDLVLADLVDEWALTITPLLVAGDAGRATRGLYPPAPLEMHLDWLGEGDGLLLTRWLRDR